MSNVAKIGSSIAQYTGNTKVGSRKAMALAIMLAQTAPEGLSPLQKKRLNVVRKRAEEVGAVQTARERASPTNLNTARSVFANGWNAPYFALDAGARVPAAVSDHGAKCAAMRDSLFPEGTTFLRLEGIEAWTHGHRLLQRVEDEGLRAELERLVGKHVFEAARHGTDVLGDAIGVIGELKPIPSTTALSEAVSAFQAAVGSYARALAADVDTDDETSVKRFFDAVAPIDALRSTRGSGEISEEDDDLDEEPDAPTEGEVPEAPVPAGAQEPVT